MENVSTQLSKQTVFLWAVVVAFALLGYFAAKEWAKLRHDVDVLKGTDLHVRDAVPSANTITKAIPLCKFPLKASAGTSHGPLRQMNNAIAPAAAKSEHAPTPETTESPLTRSLSIPPKIEEEREAELVESAS